MEETSCKWSGGSSPDPLVIKFGGTSVGDGAAFRRAASIAALEARERPVAVVVSAMRGVTDTLLSRARSSERSTMATREPLAELHRSLYERHFAAARESVSEELLPRLEGRLLAVLGGLLESFQSEDYPSRAARRASVVVHGERLSAEILSSAVASLGGGSEVSEDPIATDLAFPEAAILSRETRERCEEFVQPLLSRGAVAVVPGFVGRSPEGLPTTLGRGGSDLSATALGRGLGASEVWIMTDVNGVLDADPRLVPHAATLPRLSYREASTFAELGAKVLHPRTMEPATGAEIEVFVGNTFDPEGRGTWVSAVEDGSGVKCLALRREMMVEIPCVSGHRSETAMVVCIGSPDSSDLARGSRSLREAGIPVLHAGEARVGLVFVVSAERAEAALRALHSSLVGGVREVA